jgi:nucleotide-binding universal stress UspA family protein
MYKHILVPLDGSNLAESALPAAVALSQAMGSTVTLIHIIERNAPQEIHGERHLHENQEACDYLNQTAKRFFPPEIKVECHVHTEEVSNIPRSIVDHAGELTPDLIVMCSHGEGGLRDIIAGSIAQQVINRGKVPILLIHPDESSASNPINFKHFLVGLDGVPEHESGLASATGLAETFAASLLLVMVVYTMGTLPGEQAATGRLLPGTTAAILDITEDSAQEYLRNRANSLRASGLKVSIEVRRGDPAQQIVDAANSSGTDLIILGTHGKAGIGAFWAGSVAPKIIGMTHIPILLVPARKVD